jgi:hypothetical protein
MKNLERNGNLNLNRKLRFHPFYRSLVENEVLRQSLIIILCCLCLQVKLHLPIGRSQLTLKSVDRRPIVLVDGSEVCATKGRIDYVH